MCLTIRNANLSIYYVGKLLSSPGANKHGEHPVRISININKTRLLTTLGFAVDSNAWLPLLEKDSTKKSKNYIVSKYTNKSGMSTARMNTTLKNLEAHFSEYADEIKRRKPTKDELATEIQKVLGIEIEDPAPVATPKEPSMLERLEEFKTEAQWAHSTRQMWKTFTNHLTKFSRNIKFEYFNESGLNSYIRFLRST